MKYSYLAFSLLRSKWFMHPQIALSQGRFVASILAGDQFDFEKDPISLIVYSKEGSRRKLMQSEDDKVESIYDHAPEGSVAVIPIKNQMLKEDSLSSYGTETMSQFLREAADHKNIAAAIMDFDTGGGSVDSIPPVLDAIRYAQQVMPVIGMADMAASAGYYSIAATDLVVAGNDISSEFGSIGVMMSFADVRPAWEKEGVVFHTIYAPESNYKNLPFEKALKGEYDLIKKEELSPLARKFQTDVRNFRGGKIKLTEKGILNGRMFYAKDAIKVGLADEIGNLDYAVERALDMAKNFKSK